MANYVPYTQQQQARMTVGPDTLTREFVRRIGPDGVPEYIHRSMLPLIDMRPRPSKAQNQRAKAERRRLAGRPSYRQRQASAKAAAHKRRAERMAVPAGGL